MNYFSIKERSCRCGCGLDLTPDFLILLNKIREEYGKPINLTCGARCPKHNAKVGGAKKSSHLEGRAVDIVRTEEFLTWLMTRLDRFNIAIEDPVKTASWVHITDRLPRNNQRIIYV
jgi:hypothetical protein